MAMESCRGREHQRLLAGLVMACYVNLTGCSIFGGNSQPLLVNSDPPGADVLINGISTGTTPLQHQVSRRGDLTLESTESRLYKPSAVHLQKTQQSRYRRCRRWSHVFTAAPWPDRPRRLGTGPCGL
jgi:hypothetical protein